MMFLRDDSWLAPSPRSSTTGNPGLGEIRSSAARLGRRRVPGIFAGLPPFWHDALSLRPRRWGRSSTWSRSSAGRPGAGESIVAATLVGGGWSRRGWSIARTGSREEGIAGTC
jgi:hypothetical protein